MYSIYFIYNKCLNHNLILEKGYGNSEFKFYRLAKEIADKNYNTIICNTSVIKNDTEYIDNITYKSYKSLINGLIKVDNHDIFIIMRDFRNVQLLRKYYNNKFIVWTGDYFTHKQPCHFMNKDDALYISNDINTTIVAVSKIHKKIIEDYFKSYNINKFNITYIYNCVFTKHFINKKYEINKNDIIFGSSWSKGLNKIIKLFDKLIKKHPNFKLLLMRPNYNLSVVPDRDYIKLLNTVDTKPELSKIIGSSLCVLTSEFFETFGNLFAESYYLNTPVIATHKKNGLHEIIDNSHICNLNNYDEFEKLILSFYNNRPFVELNSQFYEENIINEWINLFNKL